MVTTVHYLVNASTGAIIRRTAREAAMEDTASTAAVAAALHAAMSAPATTTQDPHAAPQAEASQAQESVPYGVADPERWPEPADPANPGGGIKP